MNVNMERFKASAEKCVVPLRSLLIDVAIISFILTCLVAIRTMLVATDELRLFRVAAIAQLVATRTAIVGQTGTIADTLNRLSINSGVLTDRIDAQLTHATSEIHNASTKSQESAAKESKKIQDAIADTVSPAADSLVKMADRVDATPPGKPMVITVPAPTVVQTAPPETSKLPEPHIIYQQAPELPRSKGRWRRFWHHLNPRNW